MGRIADPSEWTVASGSSLKAALDFAHATGKRTLFATGERGQLVGSLSSGDVYRALASIGGSASGIYVQDVMNHSPRWVPENSRAAEVEMYFGDRIDALPELDHRGVIQAIWTSWPPTLRIGGSSISLDSPVFVVAEIGNNHNGDVELAVRMAETFAKAGADAVKFQLRSPASLDDRRGDLGLEYVNQLVARTNFSYRDMEAVLRSCWQKGISAFCTPWDLDSLHFLSSLNVPAIKIASADLTNTPLIDAALATGLPLIVSTGMSSESEVIRAATQLNDHGTPYAFLHAQSSYPASFSDINLAYMDRLKKLSNGLVGYSSHDLGESICLAAVALGAKVIEKHVTLTPDAEGNDHRVSLLPDEFESMVRKIRNIEQSIGSSSPRNLTQGELINRESLSKSVVPRRDLFPGHVLRSEDVALGLGGGGIAPADLAKYEGLSLTRFAGQGDKLFRGHFETDSLEPCRVPQHHKWGIPVRFRDFAHFAEIFKPPLLEFHLSVRDIQSFEVQWEPTHRKFGESLVVHAPEIFEHDHLLDLSSPLRAYREESIDHARRVLSLARRMKPFFPLRDSPMVVFNVGGWSQDDYCSTNERSERLDQALTSLDLLSHEFPEIELLVQTMPPRPWLFGGMRFHNLFVSPEDLTLLSATSAGVCLDVSHSMLAARALGIGIEEYFKTGSTGVKHLHISDARPPAGEGLPVGQGVVNFQELLSLYDTWCPDASFIVEVWQGHQDFGRLHREALEKLSTFGY